MVKKYKLTQDGGNIRIIYPMIPNTIPVQPRQIMANNFGSYIRSEQTGYNASIPLISGVPAVVTRTVVSPVYDRRDPSVFYSTGSITKKGVSKDSNIRITYKDPQPEQSMLLFEPNLPLLPNSFNIPMQTGLRATTPIVLNPEESTAKLEITSPDTDSIISITGDKDTVKPLYDGIIMSGKLKNAKNKLTLTIVQIQQIVNNTNMTITLNDINTFLTTPTNNIYTHVPFEITNNDAMKTHNYNKDSLRKAIDEYKVAYINFNNIKQNANIRVEDDIIPGNLIDLDQLFDLNKTIDELKKINRTNVDLNKIKVQEKKVDPVVEMFAPLLSPFIM